jgi:glucosamine--fructose-6-phosphate aminotransferase (isomerizing)
MCGIVGYAGHRNAAEIIVDGLKRLEYRGYDSAGVAVVDGDRIELRRSAGRIAELARLLLERPVTGTVGLGHTRWATHGRPSEVNAHPHGDCIGSLVVVHNGILENYLSLKERLLERGHRFRSETDTEVIAHLVEAHIANGLSLPAAVRAALREVRGAYAIGILSISAPRQLIVAKHGAGAVVLGLGPDEVHVASDIPATCYFWRTARWAW